MSLLVPDGSFGSGVIESFCHFVHFFASQQAGQRWAAGYSGTLLMTLGEAASFKPTSRRSSHLRPGQDRPGAYRTLGRALQGLCPGGTGFRHPQHHAPQRKLGPFDAASRLPGSRRAAAGASAMCMITCATFSGRARGS